MGLNIIDAGLKFTGTLTKRSRTTAILLHHRAGTGDVQSIHNQHISANGWAGIGYNFYIRLDGSIYEGRGWEYVGAHAGSSSGYNGKSIGICFEGDYSDLTVMPAEQYESGIALIKEALTIYGELEILGHRDVYPTECPGAHFPLSQMKAITLEGKEEASMPEAKDNVPNEWAKEAVEWAINNGILKGDTEGNYKLQTNITREAVLVFIHRAFKAVGLI